MVKKGAEDLMGGSLCVDMLGFWNERETRGKGIDEAARCLRDNRGLEVSAATGCLTLPWSMHRCG